MDPNTIKQLYKNLDHCPKEILAKLHDILLLLGIHYYHYTKIYFDGSRFSLTTHPNFVKQIYESGIYQKHFLYSNTITLNNLNILWNDIKEPREIHTLRNTMGIGNIGFSVVRKNYDFNQIYNFATKSSKNAAELINDNINLIYHFINYFHANHIDLLTNLENLKFHLQFTPIKTNQKICHAEDEFLKITTLNRFYIHSTNQYLSSKDLQLLSHFIRGLSIKEIANLVNRSSRTVETHLDSLKTKFNCSNIKSLFQKIVNDTMLIAELEL